MADTLQLTDKFAVALDLGTTKFRSVAVLLDENNKSSKIIAIEEIDSKGIKHGRVDNFKEVAYALKQMFTNLSNRIYNELKKTNSGIPGSTVNINKVYIALGGAGIEGKEERESYRLNNQYVDVTAVLSIQEKIRQRVENDKERVLEMINQGYNVDDDIKMEPVGCRASDVEGRFCVVTAKKEMQEDIENALKAIKVELAGFVLLPFALADVMLTDADKEIGATLIDLGAASTSIAVYRDNVRRHVRVLPMGGKIITKDIKKVCGLTTEKAELVKKKLGCAYPGGLKENIICTIAGTDVKVEQLELASIIEARLMELMSYLLCEMNKANALTATRKIVLTGRGARLDKICEKFTNEFGMDTVIGNIVDSCYGKYGSYFASLDGMKDKPSKAARKMNDFAACLGVLEASVLEPCVSIEENKVVDTPTTKTAKTTKEQSKGLFGWVNNIFGIADKVASATETIIDNASIK